MTAVAMTSICSLSSKYCGTEASERGLCPINDQEEANHLRVMPGVPSSTLVGK